MISLTCGSVYPKLTNEDCNVKIFDDNEYKGYVDVTAGSYDAVFDLTASGVVTAVGENNDGMVVGYGNVHPISTGDSVNLTLLSSGATIKSIQSFNRWSNGNQTISSVDTDKTVLLVQRMNTENSNASWKCRAELTSSTNVACTLTKAALTVFVVEFESGIKNVQRGTFVHGGGSFDYESISAVDLDKAIIINNGTEGTQHTARSSVFLEFNSSTQIRSYANGGGTHNATVGYEILEFE